MSSDDAFDSSPLAEKITMTLLGRIPKRNPGHHEFVSRDSKHIDCAATGCRWNVAKSCVVPTRCVIKPDGGCAGFEAKPLGPKTGD